MRALRWASRGALVMVAFVVASCGLFLDAPKQGLCAFDGQGTACAACLENACLLSLSDCCGNASCRGALDSLSGCTANGTCGQPLAAVGATTFQTCLGSACSTACGLGDTGRPDAGSSHELDSGTADSRIPVMDGPHASAGDGPSSSSSIGTSWSDAGHMDSTAPGDSQSGQDVVPPSSDGTTAEGHVEASAATNTTSCSVSGASCTCDAPDPSNPAAANSVGCDQTVGQGALCCKDDNWPAAGTSCSCLTAQCNHPAGGGCDCSLGSGGESCNDGVVCCISEGTDCLCTYGVSSCWDGYKTVAQCDGQAFQCESGSTETTSCSIPK